jgi:hypothetical protein
VHYQAVLSGTYTTTAMMASNKSEEDARGDLIDYFEAQMNNQGMRITVENCTLEPVSSAQANFGL